MKELNGSELASYIKVRQAKQVRALRQSWGIFPHLAIVTDSDSRVIDIYMNLKQGYGEDILIGVEVHRVEADIIQTIEQLNSRTDIQAIIVQLPLSEAAKTEEALLAVDPKKDVDGLNPSGSDFDPATPVAINWLLAGHSIDLSSKKIALVGRGRLVGAPLEKMWLNSGLSVDTFESGDDLDELINYDVVVSATGVSSLIKAEMLKSGAVVVDAGTSVEGEVVVGDLDEAVRERKDLILTPKRGGVGPLTVAALFDNVINACLKIAKNSKRID